MLHSLDKMDFTRAKPIKRRRFWTEIPAFLKAEVDAGASASSARKTTSAFNGLLRAKNLTADNAQLDLGWFDETFPLDGWDPVDAPFEQKTYKDYRNRVRPLLERMIGVADVSNVLRKAQDTWSEAGTAFKELDCIKGPHIEKSLICINNTLTMAARRAAIQTPQLNQTIFMELYADAKKGERPSLRSASRLIALGQKALPSLARLFPWPIQPIEANGAFRYNVPAHMDFEVAEFVEHAARKKYIRAKKIHTYVKKKTRTGMRTTMHALVDGLIATGHLNPRANGFASVLEEPDALSDFLGHVARRVEDGEINARHATTLVSRLPIIFERNNIDPSDLRAAIKDVPELHHYAEKAGMPEKTKQLCRKLIEKKSFRNKFLLAHAKPRLVAQTIMDSVLAQNRPLTPSERKKVIRHGVVALFCAIEIGGAPVRVENVLGMPYGADDAWIWPKGKGFQVVIPAAYVKNENETRFSMMPDEHRFTDTVQWYLDHIRPLILFRKTSEVRSHGATDGDAEEENTVFSPWLVPMLSNPGRSCPYETFHDWFTKIMRDVVGVRCTPHNFRHGQASLLYHKYPGKIGWIAVRLGDKEEMVLSHYAWVHSEKMMAEGQELISDLINS